MRVRHCHELTNTSIAMLLAHLALLACLSGCSSGTQTGPLPDFTLSVTSASLSVQPGASVSASLLATGENGFTSQVNVQVSGLPAGVSVSPSPITLTPGTTQQITLSASSSATPSSATLTFTGTSGTLTHTTQAALAITKPADFSLSASPGTVTIQSGTSSSATLSATSTNGFSSQINVVVSGLPAGVTLSPSPITLMPGTPTQLTLSADPTASPSTATLTFTGTSGSLTHSATESLSVIARISSNTPPSRMRYVRTDATTEYAGWVNPHWIVYNPPTNRFFVTDPSTNRVYALDAGTQTVIGTIIVPGAFGIDDTPDHSTLYVGTQIGDVYALDPVGMTVTKRFLSGAIGPSGFLTYSALVMADGRLALLGGQGGIPSVDGYTAFAIWNPADNSISVHSNLCLNIGVFTRTPDRSKLVMASIDEPAGLCEFDEATGAENSVTPFTGFINHFALSPDGNWIVVAEYLGLALVFDAHTLTQVNQFNVAGDTSSAGDFFVGPDSKTLFTTADSVVYAYDISTGQQVGWLPNIVVEPTAGGLDVGPISGPNIQAIDGTGLLAGPLEEGVGFLDSAMLRAGAVGSMFTNNYLSPATGPINGETQTSWTFVGPLAVTQVTFGSQMASNLSVSSGILSVTAPPGAPGPADVYAVASDGGIQLLPDAFSYGPTVLELSPNMATVDGGTGFVYGYGLGPVNSTTVPRDLAVTVGGQAASVAAFNSNAYNLLSPPFPLQSAQYTIPPGIVGPADVTVSTSSGSVTVPQAVTYLPAIKQLPLPGAALAQGVYDPLRDLYYFTDKASVRVFSKTTGSWVSSIPVPAVGSNERLWGISLSPNGQILAIADVLGQAIDVLNPGAPSVVKAFLVPQAVLTRQPAGVAVTDAGVVYFISVVTNGTGISHVSKLDTTTGQFTDYPIQNGNFGDYYLRAVYSPLKSLVYLIDSGSIWAINTSTNTVSNPTVFAPSQVGNDELSLSGDQTRLSGSTFLYDSSLNAESYMTQNFREGMNISYVYGQKLSADGRLLFQPAVSGLDVFDGRVGSLLARITLPINLSPNYDALVTDGKDNTLVAITGAGGDGVAVIDLSAIPVPPALPYVATLPLEGHSFAMPSHPTTQTALPLSRLSRRSTPAFKRSVPHVTTRKLLECCPAPAYPAPHR